MQRRIIPFPASIEIRNDRILTHVHLVDRIAKKLKKRLPPCFELDDLKSAGYIGLIHAAENFEPLRGVPFYVWAGDKVRKAIQDSIRRRKYRDGTGQESLPQAVEFCEERQAGSRRPGIESEVTAGENKRDLAGAMEELPPLERTVLRMYYGQGRTLVDAGHELHLSSRDASKVHRAGLRHCKEHFARRGRKAA